MSNMTSLPSGDYDDTFTCVQTVSVQSESALESEVQDKLNNGYILEGIGFDHGHYVAVFSRTVVTE